MYATHFGVSLAAVATVILISRIFDAVTDPLIGIFSDHIYHRFGTRKHLIVAGGLLLIVSGYFLLVPTEVTPLGTLPNGEDGTMTVSFSYLLFWFLVFYLAWTLFEIPHLAWGNDVADGSSSKTTIYSSRVLFSWLGVLVFYAIPFIAMSESRDFSPLTLFWTATSSGMSMLLLLIWSMSIVPSRSEERDRYLRTQKGTGVIGSADVFKNRPFLTFLAASSMVNIGLSGMWLSMLFIYVDDYLGRGELYVTASIIGLIIGVPMIGFWSLVAGRFGKTPTLIAALMFSALGILLLSYVSPNDDTAVLLIVAIALCFGIGNPALNSMSYSILSDIIDYGSLKNGVDRSAAYFSILTLSIKMTIALGGAAAFAILSLANYQPGLDEQRAESILGLKVAASWCPALLVFLGASLFLFQPINERRHKIIADKIHAREAKQSEDGSL